MIDRQWNFDLTIRTKGILLNSPSTSVLGKRNFMQAYMYELETSSRIEEYSVKPAQKKIVQTKQTLHCKRNNLHEVKKKTSFFLD